MVMTRSILLPLGLTAALGLGACGGTTYESTGRQPALGADATVEVSSSADNHRVKVEVDHLPPPERLAPGMERYSVWFVPNGRSAVLAGTLDYDEDSREGRLETVTPHRSFTVLVTAQRAELPHEPSDVVVFRQRVGG